MIHLLSGEDQNHQRSGAVLVVGRICDSDVCEPLPDGPCIEDYTYRNRVSGVDRYRGRWSGVGGDILFQRTGIVLAYFLYIHAYNFNSGIKIALRWHVE